MYTTEERIDLIERAEALIATLPEVVRDSLEHFVEGITYCKEWAEDDYRYGLACYIGGLQDAGLVSFNDGHMLCEYFDETLK